MSEVTNRRKKRSLILAGGGMKVAFQAGVLQVWLDEARLDGAPLTFDHADGASGGTFNLAMYCQGMSGTQIADNWRTLDPLQGIDPNWEQYPKLLYAESLFELDRYRENVFRKHWKLDWEKICGSEKEATFNVYNFSKHELKVLTPDVMSEDYLVACVSLPMWFPPVTIGGDIYIDPVFVTDANIEEAIRRGADELWIIWTVSERGEWNDGFIANYFQIIETAANGHFKRMLERIDENNAAIAEGKSGEFRRRIELKILKAEVPVNYIINLSSDRLREAVNRGVEAAREWCMERGMTLNNPKDHESVDLSKLRFTEKLKGYVALGEEDCDVGFREGRKSDTSIMYRLTIEVNNINGFVADPEHEARAEGYVRCDALGGKLPVEKAKFNLFVDKKADPRRKRMLYRLFIRDVAGCPLTLSGIKIIEDDPGFDVWRDTTTLHTRILQGHVGPGEEAQVIASGKLYLGLIDFLKLLASFRTEGPAFYERASALRRFGTLFLGRLWDVYARRVLAYGPF